MHTIDYLSLCTCISDISDMHTIHYLTLCTCISDISDRHTNHITKKLFTIQTAAWECTIQLCAGNAIFF